MSEHLDGRRRAVAGVAVLLLAVGGFAAQVSGGSPPAFAASAPPPRVGLGSKAALAHPTCAENGHTSYVYVGSGPACVSPWPEGKNNGGATAPGVTATEVKVAVLVPNGEMMAETGDQPPTDQTTGEPGSWEDAVRDYDEAVQHAIEQSGTFQTWGRAPVYSFVTASGSDETSQRADAVRVAALEPFVVLDITGRTSGQIVFQAEMANRKIVTWGMGGTNADAVKQRPYRWLGTDLDAGIPLTASFIGRSLTGQKAVHAGDRGLRSKTRTFGFVYPDGRVDVDVLRDALSDAGAPQPVAEVSYDASDPTRMTENTATIVSKMKATNATSVVLFASGSVVVALMKEATGQDYSPEWILTGWEYNDWDGWYRSADQDQMAHAFGVAQLPPAYEGTDGTLPYFNWYWGTTDGVQIGIREPPIRFVYTAMHYAGPILTAANIEKGLFAAPASGGPTDGTISLQGGWGKSVGLPYDEYGTPGSDRTLIWWNPDISGRTNAAAQPVGQGRFMYPDDAKRYAYGEFPKRKAKFFDEASSIVDVPLGAAFPGGVVPPANPCNGCPSSAAASAS